MNDKIKNKVTVCLAAACLFALSLTAVLKPQSDVSISERRRLAARPPLSFQALQSGDYMSDFEKYSTDQFPFRDGFRRLKAYSVFYMFGQKDNNGVYIADGYASQLEYPLNEASIDTAAERFGYIYERYLADRDMNIYLSVIPDKNYFLAEKNGYPSMDYDRLISLLREKTGYMEYIDITNLPDINDYYRTDTHWRQEKITPIAQKLADEMGVSISGEGYTCTELDNPFYGVHYGQAALPLPAEKLYYLESDILDNCTVYDFETDGFSDIYDMKLAYSDDPYEIFLSGARSLLTIENPSASTDRELIIFRDSFSSSLAPLLAEGYAKITLIDIRYVTSAILESLVDFKDGQDVLFIYSTLVLNNSFSFK